MPWGVAAASVVGAVSSNVASNKASADIRRSTDKSIAATQQAAQQARSDVNRLFPEARKVADQGFQGALDVFSQSAPAQVDVFQQGNIGAQQQILAGLPQIQNAILGGNVNLGALQPTNIQTDLGFFNQQLPSYTSPKELLDQQLQQEIAQYQPSRLKLTGLASPNTGFTGFGGPTGNNKFNIFSRGIT